MDETTNVQTAKGPVIYVGPSFRDSRLTHCMIFAEGIPQPEADDDLLKHLFATPAELNQALRDVKTKGTATCVLSGSSEQTKRG